MIKAKLKNGVIDIINYEEEVDKINAEYKKAIIENNVSDEIINTILSKDEEERSVSELLAIVTRKNIDDDYKSKISKLDEYKPLEKIPYEGEIKEYHYLNPYFEEKDNVIYQKHELKLNAHQILQDIQDSKKKLSDSDYIIIKAYEAKMSMSDAPYSQEKLDEVIQYRQALRDKINELEELIK